MKISLFTLTFMVTMIASAQVGIGNNSPRGLLDVNNSTNGTSTSGLVLPVVENTSSVINPLDGSNDPAEGTIVYNKQDKCISVYQAEKWNCLSPEKASAYIDCSKTSFSSYFLAGEPLENQNASITFYIKNNSLVPIQNVDISDAVSVYLHNSGANISVNGSANVSSSLQPGEEKGFTYTLSGTIPETGEESLLVTFQKFSLSCTTSHPVSKGHIEVDNLLYKGLPIIGSYLQATYQTTVTGSITEGTPIIKWYTSPNSDGSDKTEVTTTESNASVLFLGSNTQFLNQYIIVEVIPTDSDNYVGTPKTYMYPTKIQTVYAALKPGNARSKLVALTNTAFQLPYNGSDRTPKILQMCEDEFSTPLNNLAINGATPSIYGLAIGNHSSIFKYGTAINEHLIPNQRGWYLDKSSTNHWTGIYKANNDRVFSYTASFQGICIFDWN